MEFKPSDVTDAYRKKGGKYRRGGGNGKFVWIGVALVLTVGLVFGGIFGVKFIKQHVGKGGDSAAQVRPDDPKGSHASSGSGGTATKGGTLTEGTGPFPRRLLFIHVSNYLYLNPLTSSSVTELSKGPDLTRAAASRLAYEWRVPTEKDNNQVFVVSDTAPPPDDRKPMKAVVTGAYEKFFETSRSQDRIVVYFGGHVLTKKQEDKEITYLVPMEGDPDDEVTLIPLTDFFAKLEACKATQKVVIWDVCRFNPERGRQRPGSEPMTAELAKALTDAPPGVQVILTCQPGENALEFYNLQADAGSRSTIAGSSFLEATRYVAGKRKSGSKTLTSNDPIAVDEWTSAVGKRVGEVAAVSDAKAKQTLTVAGTMPESQVAFKADEPPAMRFELPMPPKGAPVAELASEISLPGFKKDDGESAIGSFPFSEEVLKPYASDVPVIEIQKPDNREKYLFRVTILEAFETIRTVWGKNGGRLREDFVGATSDAVKKDVLKEQLFPAEAIPKLERSIALLEAVEAMKAEQPKRWQAHYDYALAQCKARLAFMHEYNLALGSIRTEVLPPRDEKKGEDGYRLISSEKMKVKKEQVYAKEAQEIFDKMIVDYKGTPWGVLAKRDRTLSLGLVWQPFNSQMSKDSQ